MSTATNKYPFFDLSEIVPDPDFVYQPYQPLKPVKAGNNIPDFALKTEYALWQRFYNGSETHGPIVLRQLINKPLVISFYSKHWLDLGIEQLKHLNAIQHEIRANGGDLLVITAENDESLVNTAWKHSLSLNFYHDKDNELAEKFRVFSETDPAWNRFSGIDTNVPLPATFVISPNRQVVFANADMDFPGSFSTNEVISAINGAALVNDNKKSA